MTSQSFCYWMQGFFEIGFNNKPKNDRVITAAQSEIIQNHLNMVFKHEIDPSMGNAEHQQELNQIHSVSTPTMLNTGPFVRC